MADAEAICAAVTLTSMRLAPIKSPGQQSIMLSVPVSARTKTGSRVRLRRRLGRPIYSPAASHKRSFGILWARIHRTLKPCPANASTYSRKSEIGESEPLVGGSAHDCFRATARVLECQESARGAATRPSVIDALCPLSRIRRHAAAEALGSGPERTTSWSRAHLTGVLMEMPT